MIALDLDTLTDLEFSLALPCEKSDHAVRHLPNDPAVWDVRTHCKGCQYRGHYALCESGRLTLAPPMQIACSLCGLVGSWKDFIVACDPIPEAA